MKAIITPSKAQGTVKAPPSKSLAHRALICGALAGGSVVNNIAFSDDITATLNCLKALGASVDVTGDTVKLSAIDFRNIPDDAVLPCNESGSTLRFMIPICLATGKKIVLKGSKRLFERPLDIYENICREQDMMFEKTVDSLTVCGKLKSGNYRIKGDISSQFITGLLFVLPLLEGFSIIEIIGDLESASYVDLTLDMLSRFGIKITRMGSRFIIPGGQIYRPSEYTVEGDCSNAAFLEALNRVGGNVIVEDLAFETHQGDRVYNEIFDLLDKGVNEFDLSDCPDLAPILFSVASLKGGALFTGTARLKIKESDRASVMAEELSKFGVKVDVGENFVRIHPSAPCAPSVTLNGHNDHRIVMSLAVLSTVTGGTIDGAEAVSKSYPAFFEVLKSLKVGVETYEAR